MKIGIPKEIKDQENRVAITPFNVQMFLQHGHSVLIEKNAGIGSGFTDEEYKKYGAVIVESAKEVWDADLVLKVKEPLQEEYIYFREDLILFTYLHLANEPELTKVLLEKKVTAIGYETVSVNRMLPLLMPMSEIAGRMAVQIGAQFLEKTRGGKGILLSGVPGVMRGKVTIIGGGNVGYHAARMAVGLGADVTLFDINVNRLRELDHLFGHTLHTLVSTPSAIEQEVKNSDLVIGAVLIPGAKAPTLVTNEMVQQMEDGSVIVDVAVDQGGIVETISHTTTHSEPTYEKFGVLHYAVPNIPGAVPKTATMALTNVTIPFAVEIANKGLEKAIQESEGIRTGVNVKDGKVVHRAVADALQYPYHPLS